MKIYKITEASEYLDAIFKNLEISVEDMQKIVDATISRDSDRVNRFKPELFKF